jgi:chromosomal replication initiation ATPase DnaA
VNDESRHARSLRQLRLPLERTPEFHRETFVVSGCNREAVNVLDAWPNWPGGCLALIGPEGVGKTHLARSWAARASATIVTLEGLDAIPMPTGPILLEDADQGVSNTGLFNLINRDMAGCSLLMTARTAPRQWRTTLPDLRSRLNALLAVDLSAPDDLVLETLLLRFFRDRNIRPDKDVLPYLLRRIERSAPGALDVVARLDEAADAAGRGVTRILAREVLERGGASGDLFE